MCVFEGVQEEVTYGHSPVPEPEWFNRTVNIDTGCVFGVLAMESELWDRS